MDLAAVTYPVALLRETTRIPGGMQLRLRLYGDDEALLEEIEANPQNVRDRLRAIRRDAETGRGMLLELPQDSLQIVDIPRAEGGGKGVRFPIQRLGTYVVALERDR